MPEIVLSAEAKRDLKDIQNYITNEQERPQTALKVIEKIVSRIEDLLHFPDTGTLLSPKVNFETNYRYARPVSYLIFYRHENNQIFMTIELFMKKETIFLFYFLRKNKLFIT